MNTIAIPLQLLFSRSVPCIAWLYSILLQNLYTLFYRANLIPHLVHPALDLLEEGVELALLVR